MSKILEKAFDASKKIIRSIFNGSPNLITTSDLNRQLEAFKYQMDKLDEKTGFLIEGADLQYSLNSSKLSVSLKYSSIEFKGCSFEPSVVTLNTNFTDSAPYAYLCLIAFKNTVTYSDDTTHELAGAKFDDGTTMGAADQLCYVREGFSLTHSPESYEKNGTLVGIIAFFTLKDEKVFVNENWTTKFSPLKVQIGNNFVGPSFKESLDYPIYAGDSYDEALGKVQGYLGNGRTCNGAWGYFPQTAANISAEQYLNCMTERPATLVKVGPVFYLTLGGLLINTGVELPYVLKNLCLLLMGGDSGSNGWIIFPSLPKTYNVGRYLGASIGIPPKFTLKEMSGSSIKNEVAVTNLNIHSEYLGDNDPSYLFKNSSWFRLNSLCEYDNTKFTLVGSSAANEPYSTIAVTLMFADGDVW